MERSIILMTPTELDSYSLHQLNRYLMCTEFDIDFVATELELAAAERAFHQIEGL